MSKMGMVYLVGAGPGDPGLMTLKGRGLLASCQAVVYDHLASGRFLDWTPDGCRKIYVGKQAGSHCMSQDRINGLLVELALSGLRVARLKGGDPFVFGRGGEEILALEAKGIPYEVVPGVTSAVAVPECAGIPVTHRAVSRSFHVITGHTREGEDGLPPDFGLYGPLPGTLVFLMGLGQLPSIAQGLIASGKPPDTPAAVIEKGTLPDQRVVRAPLSQIYEKVRAAGLRTPAIIVVGETASYEMRWPGPGTSPDGMAYTRAGTLSGIRVGITGTKHFAASLTQALEEKGASVSLVLDMKVISHAGDPPMGQAYRDLGQYTWLVFTSANGVRLFFQGLMDGGRDHRALGHLKFAVIGDGTGRELAGYGFRADYTPESFCAESLAAGLSGVLRRDDRVLITRSAGGSPILTEILKAAGTPYDDIVLYEVAGMPVCGESGMAGERFDYLVFASASGVRAYMESGLAPGTGVEGDGSGAEGPGSGVREYGAGVKGHGTGVRGDGSGVEGDGAGVRRPGPRLACIGDITAGELKRYGMKACVIARKYHIEGLVDALIEDAASLRMNS